MNLFANTFRLQPLTPKQIKMGCTKSAMVFNEQQRRAEVMRKLMEEKAARDVSTVEVAEMPLLDQCDDLVGVTSVACISQGDGPDPLDPVVNVAE